MSVLELTPKLIEKAASNLQIVVIDSFYDAVNQDYAMSWLGKLFRFKVNSYRASYPYGIFPFGSSDLVGTHWLLCRKKDADLIPIMGIKTVDSRRTDVFRMDFPAFSMVSETGLESHREAISHELKKADALGCGLGFIGGWTVEPSLRNDPVMSKLYRKFIAAFCSQWMETYNVHAAITFAILRFHVEKFHAYLGMARLTGANGEYLSDFTPPPTFGEAACASILYRENQSKAMRQDRADLMELWEKRINIVSERSPLWEANERKHAA